LAAIMRSLLLQVAVGGFAGLASAQVLGKTPEVHPKLTSYKCTKRGGCVKQNTAVVLDELTHPIHQVNNTALSCGQSSTALNATVCPDEETCAKNCVIEGIQDYSKYGVTTKGSNLYLQMLNSTGSVLSPRVYLLAEGEKKYELLKLNGNEFAFDVDVSKLPCGMNGALYLSEMAEDGGQSKFNQAGAAYGSGYCDAQCFVTPVINGVVSFPSSPFPFHHTCILPCRRCKPHLHRH
jgi:cellulase